MALEIGAGLSTLFATIESLKTGITNCLEIRDQLKQGPELIKLNNLVLEAQKSLFTHMTQLMELQGKYAEACEELRKLREAEAERARYALFEVTPGAFVYRADARPEGSAIGEPSETESPHYFCQKCFAAGLTIVLRRLQLIQLGRNQTRSYSPVLRCPQCGDTIRLRE